MKIAILGGGFTGLTAAYELSQKGHSITLFEKEPVLGGLAIGFKGEKWDWYLERAYHHLFASDTDILNFAEEIGFKDIFFESPETASLYNISKGLPHLPAGRQVFPVDTPQDFLKLPLLPPVDKLRAAATLGFLKLSPFLSIYEKNTAEDFLKKTMGKRAYEVLFEQLLRKKFGKYAGNILAAFMWARITKRTKKLGYIRGGFQVFVDFLEQKVHKAGVDIQKGKGIVDVQKRKNEFILKDDSGKEERYDIVISTLPTAIMSRITPNLFSQAYLSSFSKLRYLHAVVLILETEKPILEKTYWLNICDPNIPLMFVGQHTNFMNKKYYNNHHIGYVGWYVDFENPLLKMNEKQMMDFVMPHLKKINPKGMGSKSNVYLFKSPFAQPIFDVTFVKNKPDFKTPVDNFYIANLDMTYPYDRGTNYAVKLGREVSLLI